MRRRPGIRKSMSYKRQVSFQHYRRQGSNGIANRRLFYESGSPDRPLPRSTVDPISETQSTPSLPTPPQVYRPRKSSSEIDVKNSRVASYYWKDDTRKVSAELGKICEEAFNRSSISTVSEPSPVQPLQSSITSVSAHNHKVPSSIRDRPLPATPVLQELIERRQKIIDTWGDADQTVLADMLTALDKRIDTELDKQRSYEKRAASDPTSSNVMTRHYRPASPADTMDGLKYNRNGGARAASDPVQPNTPQPENGTTIRLVTPDPTSPLTRIEPLKIRKNKAAPINSLRGGPIESSTLMYERSGYDQRLYSRGGLDTIDENPGSPKRRPQATTSTTARKWSWLGKRTSIARDSQDHLQFLEDVDESSEQQGSQVVHPSDSTNSSSLSRQRASDSDMTEMELTMERKRSWFQKMFGKTSKSKDNLAAVSGQHRIVQDFTEDSESHDISTEGGTENQLGKLGVRKIYPPSTSVDAAVAAATLRPIEVNQNWFAKFFHIKPATRVLCFVTTKAKARKELIKTLKGWHQYGLRDVVAERRAGGDVLRGRVDTENCECHPPTYHILVLTKSTDLSLKPVYFHAYLYSVLEHGRKANLSVIKFTQERGAASTFTKIVETLESHFRKRDLLVLDAARKKGIEKSLKEAGL
jgi:serine/threonine-protein kinase HSL1 (negative regulator of Swe1 kinase)